ncbi:uncharacterized protein DUF4336 [Pacificibacter maritimus]|uniref:Uncharacterized protein DUF4336 n=1 Tax=Pacificibacter maritimus TaxID=762213 RepID=A0A3N4U6D9_9RHOB|nr:DUF4336 domain-containing protein [Pacificibacter maritimus]RPE66353.1 uncharacterized protein DUF4336 [Pacificibacter maritimus]
MNALYEPLGTLKQIGPEIWIADGPPVQLYGVGFPTRMTVIRIGKGTRDCGLWVHSPIAIDAELQTELEALGPVRWLIGPNPLHYVSLNAWKKRFPEADVFAAPGVLKRAKKNNITVPPHEVLTDDAPRGWRVSIRQRIVHGHRFLHEAVFYHELSNTLILTDLIENFEPHKVGKFKAFLFKLAGTADPDGKAPIDMRMTFKDPKAAKLVIDELISWAPKQIIISHGRWYRENGATELKRAFRWLEPKVKKS